MLCDSDHVVVTARDSFRLFTKFFSSFISHAFIRLILVFLSIFRIDSFLAAELTYTGNATEFQSEK